MHEPVDPNVSFPKLEEDILGWWESAGIPSQVLKHREGGPKFVFYEGPPTMNNPPFFHHVIARAYKDVYVRYQTMRGRWVPRKAGWDCHGLPVEIEVERRLGFKRKQDIVDYGVEAFNKLCRDSVTEYQAEWERMDRRIAFWLDYDDAYWTMSPEYMESVWWSLASLHRAGLLYEGHKVAPYCPRCETPLSDHELGQPDVYQDVSDPGITVAFALSDFADGAALLVWTTTPWTLISNLTVAVHPDESYVVARAPDGKRYVLAAARVEEVLGAEAAIERSFPGSELAGKRYEPAFEFAREAGITDAWRVVASREYVTTDEGTGLVHMAPAFGGEDLDVCRANGIPMFNPVDRQGRFEAVVSRFAGQFVKDADPAIIAELAQRGLLVRDERIMHSYPHCWRCKSPLIYYALTSWYVRTTQVKDKLLEVNSAINWVPEHIRTGRMGNWLENNVDWSLSRYRFWGTPLPIWRCEQKHDTAVESLKDLSERAGRDLTGIDPHRPSVDEIAFACPECGGEARRVPDLIDVWYDSGAMPFAQFGYPHRGPDELAEHFPAEFIAEAIDQTRGWFYTLMAESVLLFGEGSYRNVVCIEHIVDAEGRKMSKSLGNVIDPWDLLSKFGADAVRWNLVTGSAPGAQKRVSYPAVERDVRTMFLTLWNVYRLYVLYANVDEFDPNSWAPVAPQYRPELDRWVLGELNEVVSEVIESYDAYDATRAGRRIGEFVEDLSNWYVRLSRRRFWRPSDDDESEADKAAAYWTLWTCLVEVSKLLAPLTPILSEALYRNLVANVNPGAPSSVHLTDFPEADPQLIDLPLAEGMAVAQTLVSLGRKARSEGGIKVRQPLGRAVLLVPPEFQDSVEPLLDLVMDELNVDECEFADESDDAADRVQVTLKPNYPVAGPDLGARVRELATALANLGSTAEDVAAQLEEGDEVTLGGGLTVGPEHVEIRREPAEGTAFAYESPFGVSLDLELTPELRQEGLARELIHALQGMRRELGLEVTDRVIVRLTGPGEVSDAVEEHRDYIADEVLAIDVETVAAAPAGAKTVSVEGHEVSIALERAS